MSPCGDKGRRLSPSGDKGMRLNLFCHCITKLTRITCECYVHDGVMSTLTVINFNGGSRSGEGRREEHDSGVVRGKSRGRMWFVTLPTIECETKSYQF